MGKFLTHKEMKETIENIGYELIDKEYISYHTKLTLKDNNGYFYYAHLHDILSKHIPSKFHKSNQYSIHNIILFCKLNNLDLELIDNKFLSSSKSLTFKDNEGYFYYTSISRLQNCLPSKFHQSNPYTIQNIKLWCKLENKLFELISEEYKSAKNNLKWKCLISGCEEIFESNWNHISNDRGCPFCSGQQVGLSNCLATKFPDVAKDWHPTKNGDLTPYDVTFGKNLDIWWQCQKNPKHEWYCTVNARTNIHTGGNCPYCSHELPSEDYNLLVFNSELCKEWNYNKNDKRPENYLPFSCDNVWWECSVCNHEWESSITNRNGINKNGCPNCAGFILNENNNLLFNNPKLCEEWNYNKNNNLPVNYFSYSNEKVWWKCKECGHEWDAIISNRNKDNGTGCPKCQDSKCEKKIEYELLKYNLPHKSQYTFKDLIGLGGGRLRFDNTVFWDKEKTKIRLLIEYDGEQHFRWVKGMMTEDQFNKQQIHDKMKDEYCLKNNIPLLRIPYWEANKIEEILQKELLSEVVIIA